MLVYQTVGSRKKRSLLPYFIIHLNPISKDWVKIKQTELKFRNVKLIVVV